MNLEAIMFFTQQAFHLQGYFSFDSFWYYYFGSSLSLVLLIKVLLIKKLCNVGGVFIMKKQLFLMGLFLCLPCFSLGQSCEKNIADIGTEFWSDWEEFVIIIGDPIVTLLCNFLKLFPICSLKSLLKMIMVNPNGVLFLQL